MPSLLPKDATILKAMEVCIALTRAKEAEKNTKVKGLSDKAVEIKNLLDSKGMGINDPLSKLFSIYLGEEIKLKGELVSPYKKGLGLVCSIAISESEFKPGMMLFCLQENLPCMLRDNGHLRSVTIPHDGDVLPPDVRLATDDEIREYFYQSDIRAEQQAVSDCLRSYMKELL